MVLAKVSGEYYKVRRGVLVNELDIYLHKKFILNLDCFVADNNISIFSAIVLLIKNDLYIGGDHANAIPEKAFRQLVSSFPNSNEKKKYAQARIAAVLQNYVDHGQDAGKKYHKFMKNKISKSGDNLTKMFKEMELSKYQTILLKLEGMLASEDKYVERQWQEEILQILLLIYPRYISVFREVPIRDKSLKEKFLDYMLVDSNGYIDIVEIKQPFNKSIITESTYRNNFIPLRELSGTIMQIEKYIFYLNRLGPEGEEYLTGKYKNDLPEGFQLKITNPSAIIIMGREHNLSAEQKSDFEVVKRKYRNVADIITYDNLLQRLKSTIEQIKKH